MVAFGGDDIEIVGHILPPGEAERAVSAEGPRSYGEKGAVFPAHGADIEGARSEVGPPSVMPGGIEKGMPGRGVLEKGVPLRGQLKDVPGPLVNSDEEASFHRFTLRGVGLLDGGGIRGGKTA
jgi:hypothetical protein